MSGGHFDYGQYRIEEIAESIEKEIRDATKKRPPLVTERRVCVKQYLGEGHYSYGMRHSRYDFKTLKEAKKYFSQREGWKIIHEEKDMFRTSNDFDDVLEISEYDSVYYADNGYYPEYSNETIEEFRKAVKILKQAYVYAQRIDWLISCDDSEESFHERLQEELKDI